MDDPLYQVILHDPVRRGPVSYVCLSRIKPPVRASAYLVSANFEPEYNTGRFCPTGVTTPVRQRIMRAETLRREGERSRTMICGFIHSFKGSTF